LIAASRSRLAVVLLPLENIGAIIPHRLV
jgi:hypothetical protein